MPLTIAAPRRQISVELLTQNAFADFGTVIENPSCRPPSERSSVPDAVSANQGSALKYIDVTHMTDYYHLAPSRKPGKAVMNMFVCSPRQLRSSELPDTAAGGDILDEEAEQKKLFDISILERHPFTSQTFIPMGLSPADHSTRYLVIVAPTLPMRQAEKEPRYHPYPVPKPKKSHSLLDVLSRARPAPFTNETSPPGVRRAHSGQAAGHEPKGPGLPDLSRIRAFLASGAQAVTYGAGTWHAPMVVLGQSSVDFVVVQFANGVGSEDCQEVELYPSDEDSEGLSVEIDPQSEQWLSAGSLRAKL